MLSAQVEYKARIQLPLAAVAQRLAVVVTVAVPCHVGGSVGAPTLANRLRALGISPSPMRTPPAAAQ